MSNWYINSSLLHAFWMNSQQLAAVSALRLWSIHVTLRHSLFIVENKSDLI